MASARPGSDPALAALLPACVEDTLIRFGEVPRALSDAIVRGVLYEASRTEVLLEVPDIARLHIRRDEIVVAPLAAAPVAALGFYLRRTPLTTLMLLRGGFACSAASVAGPDGGVLVMGRTGCGKSTLAAALLKKGALLLADDATPLALREDGSLVAFPVWPELMLWPDAIGGLFGVAPPWLRSAPVPHGVVPLYDVPADRFSADPMPVKAVYLLVPDRLDDAMEQADLQGVARLLRGTLMPYQAEIAHALADPAVLLRLYGAVSAARMQTITLPRRSVNEMTELADRIIQDCGWHSIT